METLPVEILDIVTHELPSVIDVVNLRNTCKCIHDRINIHGGKGESTLEGLARIGAITVEYSIENPHEFSYSFVSQNMDKKWDSLWLSKYRHLTDELVKDNANFPWRYHVVWRNSNISLEYAYELYLQYGNNSKKFFSPRITEEFVLTHNKDIFQWKDLTESMNPDFILAHKNLPWVWDALIKNPALKLSHITNNPDIDWKLEDTINSEIAKYVIDNCPEYVNICSFSSYIYKMSYIYKPELILGRFSVSSVSRYTLNNELFFLNNIDKYPWKFSSISEKINKNSFYIVKLHPEKSWNWMRLSLITDWNIIADNLDLPWNWHNVSANWSVTLPIVKANPTFPWSVKGLCFNPNITEQFVLEKIQIFKPYMKHLSLNERAISLRFINNHPKLRWSKTGLSVRFDANIDNFFKYPNIRWDKGMFCLPNGSKQVHKSEIILKELAKQDVIQSLELSE